MDKNKTVNMNKNKTINMDLFYFKKYSRYLSYGEKYELFLTLKNLKRGCYISIHPRYEKSLIRILHNYKMNYVINKFEIPKYNKTILDFFISKKHISEEEKKLFQTSVYSKEKSIILGKFLGYPYSMDMHEVNNEKDGSIEYNLILNKNGNIWDTKNKKQMIIYRIPKNKVNKKLIQNSKNMVKKYKKCIKDSLGTLYPNFDIQLVITI